MPTRDRPIIGYPIRVLAALGGRGWLRHAQPPRAMPHPSPYLGPALRSPLRDDADLPPRLAAVRDRLRTRTMPRSALAAVADELLRNAAAEALAARRRRERR